MKSSESSIFENFSFVRKRYYPRVRLTRSLLAGVPLADVVLLFWIFLLIQSSFVLQPGLELSLPRTPFTSGISYSPFVLTITRDHVMYFEDEQIEFDELEGKFESVLTDHARATLLLEADVEVKHGHLTRVYNAAVAAGMTNVMVSTRLP